MMKECAELCNYSSKRCTLRGLRSYGITKLVNTTEAVSETDKLIASRHTNLNTHAHYQRSTKSSRDARYKVFGAKNKNKADQKVLPGAALPSSVAPDATKDAPAPSLPSHSTPVGQIQQTYSNVSNQVMNANMTPYHYIPAPTPIQMFHPGFGMPGFLPMTTPPAYSVISPSTTQLSLPTTSPQTSISQTTLSSIQEVMKNLNKKLEEVENKLNKKED